MENEGDIGAYNMEKGATLIRFLWMLIKGNVARLFHLARAKLFQRNGANTHIWTGKKLHVFTFA